MAVKIKGQVDVIRNLYKNVELMKRRATAGLMQGALIIKRRSMQLTPVDTGNLKGTCYTKLKKVGALPVAEIGYTAAYAIYVHEIDYKHKPPTQWKFLETALKEKQKDVKRILKESIRI